MLNDSELFNKNCFRNLFFGCPMSGSFIGEILCVA